MATLRDGLGFDEMNDAGDPGSKVAQIWITGSITSQDNITAVANLHGTNVSGVGSVFGGRVVSTNLITGGTNISGVGSIFGARVFDRGTTVRMPATAAGAGSPVNYSIQQITFFGSGATDGGSKAWIVFPEAYGAAPSVVLGPGSGALGTDFGLITVVAGSFQVESSAASRNFRWISVG